MTRLFAPLLLVATLLGSWILTAPAYASAGPGIHTVSYPIQDATGKTVGILQFELPANPDGSFDWRIYNEHYTGSAPCPLCPTEGPWLFGHFGKCYVSGDSYELYEPAFLPYTAPPTHFGGGFLDPLNGGILSLTGQGGATYLLGKPTISPL